MWMSRKTTSADTRASAVSASAASPAWPTISTRPVAPSSRARRVRASGSSSTRNERMQRERWHRTRFQLGRQLDRIAQTIAEPGLLDAEVGTHDLELRGQRHRVTRAGVEREAQQRGELLDELLRALRVLGDEGGD